jgi:adenylate cyclase
MTVRILMVDDEPDAQELFRQNFRREIRKGMYSFDFALSGEEALKLLKSGEPPKVVLVLSDINMPGMTGIDLLAETPGGERRVATFLFTDLADFTPLVESLDSEVIVGLLNAYLDGLTEVIFAHGGTVMKIVGDAVHAIFGAPVEDPEHAAHAVSCALAIDDFAMRFRTEQTAAGVALGVTRIGVNSGPAIIGNFGGAHFFDYTAYGDAVNTAARLEHANKAIGTRICVGESVVAQIPDFIGRPVGTLLLKGKSQALRCYEPLPAERAAEPATAGYRDAFALLEAEDPKARQAFAALVGQYDEDPLTMFHLGRLLAGATGVAIEVTEK